ALGSIIDRPLTHVNAAKAVLSGIANAVAAIGFALFGPVRWAFVVPLAVGLFFGGLAGPWIARRLPPTVFRALIGVCGLGVAAMLAWRTYAGG
ncbi:MAG: sulfite exporter TauE/SafE family protein, partial [Chloroflexota bacterium]|nr:sulfite exporter TauE/SafE family protein [Chloroflexota bacterium]